LLKQQFLSTRVPPDNGHIDPVYRPDRPQGPPTPTPETEEEKIERAIKEGKIKPMTRQQIHEFLGLKEYERLSKKSREASKAATKGGEV
jgi:RNA:NAD 2'-phosphotransferase (TPT1/KptA family)